MQPFTFDISTLSPATSIGLGSLANSRPRERFEDHLGQATHPPRSDAPERSALPQSASPADRTGDTSQAEAKTTDDAPDEDRDRNAEGHQQDRNASGAPAYESATVPTAERLVNRRKLPDNGHETPPPETNAVRAAGKSTKSKARAAHARLSPVDDPTASQQSVRLPIDRARGKLITDSTAVEESPEQVSKDKARAAAEKLTIDLGAINAPTGDGDANDIAAVIASPANQPNAASDATVIADPVDAITVGTVQIANAEKAEPQGATKRGRSGKASAITEATGAQNDPTALAQEPHTAAAGAGEISAAVELVAALDTPVEKDTTARDAPSSDSKDHAQPHQGSVSATLASRQEKLYESSGRSEGLTEAERVRFVQRVARAFHSMGDEGGELRLRLSPPELGSLRLEVSMRDGMLSARLETETASARNVLLDNLPALRERLAEQNIKVERFEVNVRDEQRQPSQEHLPGQPDVPRQGQRDRPRGQDSRKAPAIVQAIPRGTVRIDKTSELNIVI